MKRTDVGYCRPPEEHRFKAGSSGNPRGRPKRKESVYETASRVMAEPVHASTGGNTVKLSTIKALFRRTCTEALRGDVRAMKRAFELIFTLQPPGRDPEEEQMAQSREAANAVAKVLRLDPEDILSVISDTEKMTPEKRRREAWMRKKLAAKRRELVAADRANGLDRN